MTGKCPDLSVVSPEIKGVPLTLLLQFFQEQTPLEDVFLPLGWRGGNSICASHSPFNKDFRGIEGNPQQLSLFTEMHPLILEHHANVGIAERSPEVCPGAMGVFLQTQMSWEVWREIVLDSPGRNCCQICVQGQHLVSGEMDSAPSLSRFRLKVWLLEYWERKASLFRTYEHLFSYGVLKLGVP